MIDLSVPMFMTSTCVILCRFELQ